MKHILIAALLYSTPAFADRQVVMDLGNWVLVQNTHSCSLEFTQNGKTFGFKSDGKMNKLIASRPSWTFAQNHVFKIDLGLEMTDGSRYRKLVRMISTSQGTESKYDVDLNALMHLGTISDRVKFLMNLHIDFPGTEGSWHIPMLNALSLLPFYRECITQMMDEQVLEGLPFNTERDADDQPLVYPNIGDQVRDSVPMPKSMIRQGTEP